MAKHLNECFSVFPSKMRPGKQIAPSLPLLVMGNRGVINIEASASLRWKPTPPATRSAELGYRRPRVTLWTL